MSKTTIGILFIIVGLAYSSLAFDRVNQATVGFLVKNKWIKAPIPGSLEKDFLGPKTTIILYSVILVTLGVFMLIAQ